MPQDQDLKKPNNPLNGGALGALNAKYNFFQPTQSSPLEAIKHRFNPKNSTVDPTPSNQINKPIPTPPPPTSLPIQAITAPSLTTKPIQRVIIKSPPLPAASLSALPIASQALTTATFDIPESPFPQPKAPLTSTKPQNESKETPQITPPQTARELMDSLNPNTLEKKAPENKIANQSEVKDEPSPEEVPLTSQSKRKSPIKIKSTGGGALAYQRARNAARSIKEALGPSTSGPDDGGEESGGGNGGGGTPQGQSRVSTGPAAMQTPYALPVVAGTQGPVAGSTDSQPSDTEEGDSTPQQSTEGGAQKATPNTGNSIGSKVAGQVRRKAAGIIRRIITRMLSFLVKLGINPATAPWILGLIAVIAFVMFLIIILGSSQNTTGATVNTIQEANKEAGRSFFKTLGIKHTTNTDFIEKTALNNITEINSVTLNYELIPEAEYSKFFSQTSKTRIKEINFIVDFCVPLSAGDVDLDVDMPLLQGDYTVTKHENCMQLIWKSAYCTLDNVCNRVPPSAEIEIAIEFPDGGVPIQSFGISGNPSEIFSVSILPTSSIKINVENQDRDFFILPATTQCFDVTKGANTSKTDNYYLTSCNTRSSAIGGGSGSGGGGNGNNGGGSANTPPGCPFEIGDGNVLSCNNSFITAEDIKRNPGLGLRLHPAIDVMPKTKSGTQLVGNDLISPIKGTAKVLNNKATTASCGQAVRIISEDRSNFYEFYHLNPNSGLVAGKVEGDTFEVNPGAELGTYFTKAGAGFFPGTIPPELCWFGAHVHYQRVVNGILIDPFKEIESTCNVKMIKGLELCIAIP